MSTTPPVINERRSRRRWFELLDAGRAVRLAERDAAYRLALGVAREAPLPAALGTQTGVELTESSRARRP
jgi:hypothetical protein